MEFQASACGDSHKLSANVQRALYNTGINLHHFVSGSKGVSQKAMLVSMAFWSKENPPPANIVLISGDDGFSVILHQLRMQGFRIFLIRPQGGSCVAESLLDAATSIWHWDRVAQSSPKESKSLAGSRRKNYHGRPVIRGALTTLRSEMLPSTEENIYRCIVSSTVVTFNLPEALNNGVSKLYIPTDEQPWYFISTADYREYGPQVWDDLRNFLSSNWVPLSFRGVIFEGTHARSSFMTSSRGRNVAAEECSKLLTGFGVSLMRIVHGDQF
ncbi:hypothetical protein SELMODRAFT_417477 [Selaginella moellendorffii]|uniref:NYN domain-containing protein n=1 Tax=Selaginella moellendorffii TaxID=88036 RepID=D8S2C5_SELML|nr:hypothetical protein SELMODRAFT_417477 [Selaginella moellendorffii]